MHHLSPQTSALRQVFWRSCRRGLYGLYSTFIAPIYLLFFLPQGFSSGQRSQAVGKEIRVVTKCPAWRPCQRPLEVSEDFSFVLLPKMRFKFILFGFVLIQLRFVEDSEGDLETPTACLVAQHKPSFPCCNEGYLNLTVWDSMPHTVHFSSAYLPKAENKESKQEQPSQDTANEDPQRDEDRAGLNHLQEALHREERWFLLAPFCPVSFTPQCSKLSPQTE